MMSERFTPPKARQIVGIVLSQVLNELAKAQLDFSAMSQPSERSGRSVSREPRAVVWLRDDDLLQERELDAKRGIDAVNRGAREFGVKAGQTIAEARSLVAHLAISVVTTAQLRAALERVAEAMSRFGSTVAVALPDTVWVEVTGSTHLFGGEASILEEMRGVLDELGHQARLALTDGPQLARAFAWWETRRQGKPSVVVGPEQKSTSIKALPITSLPLSAETKVGLAKLGLLTAGDLLERDAAIVTSRLGERAREVMSLLRGQDTTPLDAYRPLVLPKEELDWDEPLAGNEPVLFALRRLTTQVAARLRGRGLAAQTIELTLKHDRAIARFRGKEALTKQRLQLVSPLSRAEDLWRVLSAKLAKIHVEVPNVGVVLEVLSVEETKQRQLDLAVGFSKLDAADPERMAVLFSELATDIGVENFGTLRLANTHKPEKMTLLCPVETAVQSPKRSKSRRSSRRGALGLEAHATAEPSRGEAEQMGLGDWKTPSSDSSPADELPTRLLTSAVRVQTRFKVGELLPLGTRLYTITKVTFQRRLEAVEWWSNEPCSRDYVRLGLSSTQGELQVLAYIDRITHDRYVQGWYD